MGTHLLERGAELSELLAGAEATSRGEGRFIFVAGVRRVRAVVGARSAPSRA